MNRIIVDTNIVFSALLNTDSRIGRILINGKNHFEFYAPEYLKYEVFNHKEKIKALGKFTERDFFEVYVLIIKNITVLNHSIIPETIYKKAELLCREIDIDDTVFVAFSYFTKSTLWTGDKRLIKGLADKGFDNVISTSELYQLFLSKENLK